ncbi:MAG: hypothetical protein JWO33_625, partial [Caulobacteraceae bacterium]|nr:hypothetical protein [Caulobacteraceae bacterium]
SDLRHNEGDGDLASLGWAGALAAPVCDWFRVAAAGEQPDRAPLEAAAAELARRQAEMGVLISPLSRDHDTARVDLLETQAQLADLQGELARLQSRAEALQATVDEADRALDVLLSDG